MPVGLTNKQQVFIAEYVKCWNATEAAKRAGYSEKTAYSIGQENLKKPEIAQVIESWLDEQKMSAKEVLARLSAIGRSDIADFVGVESQSDLLNPEYQGKTHVIKKFEKHTTITRTKDGGEIENQYTKLELHDSLSALDKMGRHHALFTDRVEHTGPVTLKVEYATDNPPKAATPPTE